MAILKASATNPVAIPLTHDSRPPPQAGGSIGGTPAGNQPPVWASRADAADGPMLPGLLHDLGHGLATLSWLIAAVRGEPAPGTARQDLLAVIEQETTRLLRLVRDGGRHLPATGSVRLDEILQRTVELAQATNATSVTLAPGPSVHLPVDDLLVWRVVANVVDNALRAAGPRGNVTLSVVKERDVVIEVVDDGPGFGRGPAGTASLGLGIVAGLMSECGGSLDVLNLEPHGTCLRLTFPAGLAPCGQPTERDPREVPVD